MTDTPQHDGTRSTRHTVVVPNSIDMVSLLGPGDEFLGLIEESFDADVHVRGNAALLERLVGNLAENAVRHGSDPEIELRAGADAATIVVRNGGAPIPPDVLARLSDPFERGNRTRGSGVGLGLSIVRAIAESHGGTLALRAPDRGGLQAEVRLPLAGVTRT